MRVCFRFSFRVYCEGYSTGGMSNTRIPGYPNSPGFGVPADANMRIPSRTRTRHGFSPSGFDPPGTRVLVSLGAAVRCASILDAPGSRYVVSLWSVYCNSEPNARYTITVNLAPDIQHQIHICRLVPMYE